MRIFNSIKKSRRESSDIDEKIEYLNKELEKTGLHEVAANSTSGVYVGSETNPNEKYAEFTAKNFNGVPFAMSGDSNLGQGSFGGASIRASDGAALSPDGTTTQTKGDLGSGGFKLAIPGERKSSEHRMTGPILWYWTGSSWGSLEYNSAAVHGNQPYPYGGDNAGWGYWGSNFLGFPMLRSDGAPFASLFTTLNDSDGNQFDPNTMSNPTTTVLTQNKLDDPDFIPINIDGLSGQGFDYLKKKAIASGGVNYDLYNWINKTYGGAASNWYENNPTLPHQSNPFIPRPEAPYVPLASAPSPLAGASDGTEFAFFGGNNKKNTPPPAPTKRTRKGSMDATKASTGMYPSMTPEIFLQKYGISYNEYLALP